MRHDNWQKKGIFVPQKPANKLPSYTT